MTSYAHTIEGEGPGDAGLVQAVLAGNVGAAESFVRQYWDELFRVAYLLLHDRGLAEDVAQESVLSALRGLSSFDQAKALRPWVRRIAANRSIDSLRAAGARPPERLGRELTDADLELTAEPIAELALSEDVSEALSRLPEHLRIAVVLRHLFDFTPREIAEMAGLEPATARTHIHRGLLQLREELKVQTGADQ